jgi:hypothetical protein
MADTLSRALGFDPELLREEDPVVENVRTSAERWGAFPPPGKPDPKAELRATPKAYPGQRDQFIQHATKYIGPNAAAEGGYGLGASLAGMLQEAAHGNVGKAVEESVPLTAIFFGPKARGANLETLKQAKSMEKKGAHRDEIWHEKRWGRLPEGKWASEMSDKDMVLRASPLNDGRSLIDHVDHPEFFEKYPQTAGLRFYDQHTLPPEWKIPSSVLGFIDPKGVKHMYVNKNPKQGPDPFYNDPLTTAAHEKGHLAQNIEGWEKGGSFFEPSVRKLAKDVVAPSYMPRFKELQTEMSRWSEDYMREKGLDFSFENLENSAHAYVLAHPEKAREMAFVHGVLTNKDGLAQELAYNNLGGEAMSRKIMYRQPWDDYQRAQTPPWAWHGKHDVPWNMILLRKMLRKPKAE